MKLYSRSIKSPKLTWLAFTDVSSFGISAPSSQADKWILQTLIHIQARQSGVGQAVAVVALALEGSIHVDASTIGTHASLEKKNLTVEGSIS